jgi:hypothetical protein
MTDRPIIGFDPCHNGDPAIVVVVQRDGSHIVDVDGVCTNLAAELLHGIAHRLVAEHGPGPCTPEPARPHPTGGDPAQGGRLDHERKVWRDHNGDAWDLTLTWADAHGHTWRWNGVVDAASGAPILRCDQWTGAHPLDVLRAARGPIRPVVGGAA